MNYVTSFILKFIMTTVILWIILGLFYDVSFLNILLTSIILSVISYIADVYILPYVSNFWATIADFGLAFAGIWIIAEFFYAANDSFADAALISAIFIAVGEYFFHRYMKSQVIDDRVSTSPSTLNISNKRMQTEFSSELDDNNKDK
ncbi:YndM family protein [Ornithinibacillus contaminans]|uniref:YndM family protein n=1 Tax=Ornithinibacillus contaminans TaxID=694055 RepID=UPI00064DB441|nr:YndM family protein [Ornithinibacillus contaminans]